MGKSRKRSKASRSRLNPLAKTRDGNDSSKDANLINTKIQPLLKNLQSSVPNDRSMALSSISVLCEDPHMRFLLLKEKLVQTVSTTLINDSNTDIVIESLGLLRNLVLEEGYDVAIHLWRIDIWSNIQNGAEQTLKSLNAMIEGRDKVEKQSRRLLFEYADNLISLVVALTNASDDILEEVLNGEKLDVLLIVISKFIEYGFSDLPTYLQNSILDFIYDFSSESFEFVDKIVEAETIWQLIRDLVPDLASSNELTIILLQGIRLQFLDAVSEEELTGAKCSEIIGNILAATLRIDLDSMKQTLSNVVNKDTTELDTSKLKDFAKQKQLAMMQYQALETALDILTGVIEIIASSQIDFNDHLMQLLMTQVPAHLRVSYEEFPDRTLIAWNNLLWLYITINCDVDLQQLRDLWSLVHNGASVDATEAVLLGKMSVVWAILKLCGVQGHISLLRELQVWDNTSFGQSVIAEFGKSKDIGFQRKCCGALTCVASYQGQSEQCNKFVGDFFSRRLVVGNPSPLLSFLLTWSKLCLRYTRIQVTTTTRRYLSAGQYAERLANTVVPHLRSVFKMVDKNKTPELKERCTACLDTLQRFIEYKVNEAASK
ncbi:Syo1p KNAG_0D04380 [Huiozyma naganishii CBS 8797]|uniref:Synchronized import protein 1 n=1 Tax=Huiozyma naganishii (strain ATCC MYA-139 / BCRC 22969 / CBS 8797 / KCTC 17520 / NBRC 10181 / NCYC 3082 / Yp74L-3) TaxID=1071383 RepID=J7RL07_HUIN7|nr:hypothetical protein KNAG_0D04380 [Kazachstania naganishii CBS 8797]CCK70183.1 hypothetical protein KNAG_0D04380 [Kazachstania naganishii CBS 8797]